jgi:hypothetical protein
MSSWSLQQTFSVPCEWDEDNDDLILGDKSVPDYLLTYLKANIENLSDNEPLLVDAECSGYYEKGHTTSDPYYCYPPEGEDERIITQVWIPGGDVVLRNRGTDAERTHFKWIADHVRDYIYEIDLYRETMDD